jgi:hypothetical protein
MNYKMANNYKVTAAPAQHTTHTREIFMAPAEFEPETPTIGRSQNHTLDRVATGIGDEVSAKREPSRMFA